MTELELTAYHEAGHAVYAHLNGKTVKSATVVAAGNILGRVVFAWVFDDTLLGIELGLAGPLAQSIFEDRENCIDPEDSDCYLTEESLERLAATVEDVLRQHWKAVHVFAQTLLQEGILMQNEIDALFASLEQPDRQLVLF